MQNRLAQHFIQITNVDPSLSPPGKELISATVLDDQGMSEEKMVSKVASEILRLSSDNTGDLEMIKVISVPQALPCQSPENLKSLSTLLVPEGIHLAGDLVSNASLQNALQSGREAALTVMNRL